MAQLSARRAQSITSDATPGNVDVLDPPVDTIAGGSGGGAATFLAAGVTTVTHTAEPEGGSSTAARDDEAQSNTIFTMLQEEYSRLAKQGILVDEKSTMAPTGTLGDRQR